jgi:2-acylglycerol O-acyltransferase 2
MKAFQVWAEKWVGFTPVLFFGRGIFQYNWGLIPHRQKVTVVVGGPINVDKVENPTHEQVEALHAQYVTALKKLYQENNVKYGDVNVSLIIE